MGKRKFGEKSEILYRTERFEIRLTDEEYRLVLAISASLRALFNSALAERTKAYNRFVRPIRAKLKLSPERTSLKRKLKFAYKQKIPTLYDQINGLTAQRDPSILRNWQEETLDALNASYTSFYGLRKNKDKDARPPRERKESYFHKIPGRSGFKILGGKAVLSLKQRSLSFPIPKYQREKLERAVKFKKFELYRDEPRLEKPGRFWISIACELAKPEATFFNPERAVYLALGASSLGVISPLGEEVLPLWRSDKHWVPLIESVKNKMEEKVKGSLTWVKLNDSKRRMQVISARQRLQDEREVVSYLFKKYGHHFVVTELVVRSKEGKLADATKLERRGILGLNWAAQNTGSLGRLILLLEEKVKEYKGSVRKHKLVLDQAPPGIGVENKLWMARRLKESFLAKQKISA
jgi:putative transposase